MLTLRNFKCDKSRDCDTQYSSCQVQPPSTTSSHSLPSIEVLNDGTGYAVTHVYFHYSYSYLTDGHTLIINIYLKAFTTKHRNTFLYLNHRSLTVSCIENKICLT